MRLILNGKNAGRPDLKDAITETRRFCDVDVRVTEKKGDMQRFVDEALKDGCDTICVGGGDGSLNEAVGQFASNESSRSKLGVIPLGTANDFASACGIPQNPMQALHLCAEGKGVQIDLAEANNQPFLNVASLGFGAKVTVETSELLKRLLGGTAYAIESFTKAPKFESYNCEFLVNDQRFEWSVLAAGICNGPFAGGGCSLAKDAKIDDGMLNVVILLEFSISSIGRVYEEFSSGVSDGEFVKRFRVDSIEWSSDRNIPLNLDGESYDFKSVQIRTIPRTIQFILPEKCPRLASFPSNE